MDVHFSSEKQDWETPQDFFDELDREFDFTLDVCATKENAKTEAYIYNSSLQQSWYNWNWEAFKEPDTCWMNPPYGRAIGKWIKKASEEASLGAIVVALLPARTDTKWFHDYIYKKHEIRFLKGRLKFVGAKSSAPFPSMIVVFRKDKNG